MRLKEPEPSLSLVRDPVLPKDPDLRLSVLPALTRAIPLGELGSGSSMEPQSAEYSGVCTLKESL